MHNFDATENDYCFPQGFSILGVAHWNKFHASVVVDAALARQVGGYDPSLPWGLEDWNFWLHAAKFNPKVDCFVCMRACVRVCERERDCALTVYQRV